MSPLFAKQRARGIANLVFECDHSPSMRLALASIRRRLTPRLLRIATVAAFLSAVISPANSQQAASRTVIATRLPAALPSAVDAGPSPSSQRLSLTFTLAQTPAQTAALDKFLADVTNASSPSYHQWLTPQQFAKSYGATSDQLAVATAWLQSQGLTVDAVSPAATRISASGFVSQVEPAFATSIHNYQANGHVYFASAIQPSLPAEAASLFVAIDGLDNLPSDLGTLATGSSAQARTRINFQASSLTLPVLANLVDANASPLLSLDATGAIGGSSPSRTAGLSALFRQAAAQGITTLVYGNFGSGDIAFDFPETTAAATPGSQPDVSISPVLRPSWQIADGLPSDGLRHVPDLTADSFADLSQALAAIARQNASGRLGNINASLYEFASLPGLYTQPDKSAAGTWEPATGLGLVDTALLAKAFPHGVGPTNVQITSSNYSPIHGQTFILTAQVASTVGGAIPTGIFTFSAVQPGFNTSTATIDASGLATSIAYLLPGGTYSITATYSGDSNYASSNGTVNITVQPEAAVFTISAPSTVALGANVTATVTLTSPSGVGTPSASVTVTPSGITSAPTSTKPIAGTGGTATGTFTFTTNQAGTVTLQASCTSSDPSFTCYTPQTSTTTVPQATPTVSLNMTPKNPAAGFPVTLSATVTGIAGIGTTGSVQFFDGSTSLGFGSAPNATFSGNLSPGTNHVITAVYQGDSNYLKATSNSITTSVSTSPTTTTVNASGSTFTYGQSVALNITVATTTVVNGTQPTGTLTFTGAGNTTTAAVSGGSANVTLSNLTVGTYTIGTSYSGDSNYAPSTGNNVVVAITQATASLSTNLSSTSFTTGSTSTLTVTVTLNGNALVPSGSTFIATIAGVAGASYTGNFIGNVGGNTATGSVIIPAPPAGTYTMQVVCGANINFTCTPNTLTISSTATTGVTGTTPTTTTLAITPVAPAIGQAITFTATVSASAAAIAANPLAGTVNFYDGTTLMGSGKIAPVSTAGVTTYVATLLYTFPGTTTAHTVTATYVGNTLYASSSSTGLAITLAAAAATVTLTSSVTNTTSGISISLTATVSGTTTTGAAPTGTVSFYLVGPPAALIGTATLGATGNGVATAVIYTSTLPSGSASIYAVYNGDSNFSSAISNTITLGVSDYAVAFIPTNITIPVGKSGTVTTVVTPINGFTGTVTLSCSADLVVEINCGFSPSILNNGGSSTLTIVTTPAKTNFVRGTQQASLRVIGGVSFAALLCWMIPGKRRRKLPTMLLALLALSLTFNLGCSAGNFNSTSVSNAGTPLGTTLLTITTVGTSGANVVRHSYYYQVTIQ